MFNRTNWDRKSQLSGILTEPLNPLDLLYMYQYQSNSSGTVNVGVKKEQK